jgi:hypothetical protein
MHALGSSSETPLDAGAARATGNPHWWPKLVALCSGVLVSLMLAEGLVLLVMGEQPKFPRHVVQAPWGLRYNDPGSSYRHKSADMTTYFRINHQGMRSDRDVSYEKPPGVKRIVSLGDSFTIGFEVDADKCFSSILEAELRQAGLDVEVLNAGVSGYSNAEELLYLERELIKYAPDLVLVSFYGNDVEDNLRTQLFRSEAGRLVAQNAEYVPGGSLANFLNTNVLFNLLSERSNAFALAKERLATATKPYVIDKNIERIRDAIKAGATPREDDSGTQLTAAIFERMYAFLRPRKIPLVIQSIPIPAQSVPPGATSGPRKLVELFPLASFDVGRSGLYFVSAKDFLDPSSDTQLLYWTRSHGHWTPFSHATSGRQLAELILREKLLQ